jgi:hypothetical protein
MVVTLGPGWTADVMEPKNQKESVMANNNVAILNVDLTLRS